MAIMDAIIAQGDHTRGVSAQSLLGGVAAVKNIEGRNKLLGLNQKINQANLDEFNANAGIRESQRTEYLDNQFIKVSDMALTQLEGGDLQGAVQTAQRWKQQLTDIGVTDHRDVDMFLSAAQSQDPQALAQAIRGMQALREHGMKAGVLAAPAVDKPQVVAAGSSLVGSDGSEIFHNPAVEKPTKPATAKDANGRLRYVDGDQAGELVFDSLDITPEQENNLATEAGVRKEFNGLLKDFNKVSDSYARVKASAEDPSAAGDLALIFNYMKMLDPGSTVREGEFATAQNAAGVPGRIHSLYNNIVDGERMNETQRGDFIDRSNKLYEAAFSQAQKTADAYTIIANNAGLNVESILANFTVRSGAELAPLPPGFELVD